MEYISLSKRLTGRTTRMLEHAVELSKEGKTIYLIMASEREAKRARRQLNGMIGRASHGIKAGTLDTLEILGDFSLKEMRFYRPRPNIEVLVDHFIIELEYAKLLEMLQRYDAPTQNRQNFSLKRDDDEHNNKSN